MNKDSLANPLNGTELDRTLKGLPVQPDARVFGRSPVERPFTSVTPTNPKNGTRVKSSWDTHK